MTGDLYQQNIPFLYNFNDVIKGTSNLFLNISISGGSNNYYESIVEIINPINYIILLFNRSNIYLSVNIILIIYIVLSTIAFNYMLNKLYPKNSNYNIILSIAYGLSGYSLYMYQVIRWLSLFALFPLFIVAIKKLIDHNKGIAFSVFLAYFIALSIQFGLMTLLFVLFGSIIYIFSNIPKSDRKYKIFNLSIYTFVGILLSGIIFIPNIFSILNSTRAEYNTSLNSIIQNFMLIDLFDRIFIIFNPITFLCLIIYIINIVRKKYDRNFWGLMSLFMVFTSLFSPINKMWHLGSYMCFPLRYGYMVILVLLCYAKTFLCNLKNFNINFFKNIYIKILYYFLFSLFLIFLLIFSYINSKNIALGFSSLNISVAFKAETIMVIIIMFTAFVAGIMALFNKKREIMLSLVIIFYCFCGLMICITSTSDLQEYIIMNSLSTYNLNDKEYIRIKENDNYHLNGSLVSKTNSLSGYLPSGDMSFYQTMKIWRL